MLVEACFAGISLQPVGLPFLAEKKKTFWKHGSGMASARRQVHSPNQKQLNDFGRWCAENFQPSQYSQLLSKTKDCACAA
jgi:hypothetical protein